MIEPIRIGMVMGKMLNGGVEAVIMNYYREMDHRQIQFDFIIDSDSKFVPTQEIKAYQGNIIYVPPYQDIYRYIKAMKKVFKQNKYYIVHSNINAMSVFPLAVAKFCGVPIRIAHNHTTTSPKEIKKNLIKSILKNFSTVFPTAYISPTESTGKWLFGEKVAKNKLLVLKNALQVSKFKFDINKRNTIRKKLRISENSFVVGNVGRLEWQKNQQFILKIFYYLRKELPNAMLILVGEGSLKSDLAKQAARLGIQDAVVFVNNTNHIEDYYQAMDYFIFPSYYEGLGMVAVEAQISGLNGVISEGVPDEAIVTNNFHKLRLEQDAKEWCNYIKSNAINNKKNNRNIDLKTIEQNYGIKNNAHILQEFYLRLVESILSKEK